MISAIERLSLALDIPADQSFDEWRDMGQKLCAGSRVVNWWLGDWWNAGTHRYGQRAKMAADGIFGKELQSLIDIGTVCRAFETTRRREVLSFTHHREAMALKPTDADHILDRAAEGSWSTRELRAAVKALIPQDGLVDDPDTKAEQDLRLAWNRASEPVRDGFLEAVAFVGTGPMKIEVNPYRAVPLDFADIYIVHGFNGSCVHYRAHWRNVSQWIDESGGEDLRIKRIDHLKASGRKAVINRVVANRRRQNLKALMAVADGGDDC